MYNEDDFLQLSGIQHFVFCRRQWALAYIELQWQENVRTVEGHLLHERAHDGSINELRGNVLVSRAMPVHSRELGVSGECDVVEFHRTEEGQEGVTLHGREGMYLVIPIEYKRGKPKTNDADILQLVTQAMCLEEMLCCDVPFGYLYYGETRRRTKVGITEEWKSKARSMLEEMHKYDQQQYTPKVKPSKACNACSLKDICIPKLNKRKSVSDYIEKAVGDLVATTKENP